MDCCCTVVILPGEVGCTITAPPLSSETGPIQHGLWQSSDSSGLTRSKRSTHALTHIFLFLQMNMDIWKYTCPKSCLNVYQNARRCQRRDTDGTPMRYGPFFSLSLCGYHCKCFWCPPWQCKTTSDTKSAILFRPIGMSIWLFYLNLTSAILCFKLVSKGTFNSNIFVH